MWNSGIANSRSVVPPIPGVLYHEDLSQRVSRAEADAIGQIVERAVQEVLPGAQITLTGGFRRLVAHAHAHTHTHTQTHTETANTLLPTHSPMHR